MKYYYLESSTNTFLYIENEIGVFRLDLNAVNFIYELVDTALGDEITQELYNDLVGQVFELIRLGDHPRHIHK